MPAFRELIAAVSPLDVSGNTAVEVGGIAYDSRRVRPGDLFVARRGRQSDGHRHIADAVARGAVACLVEDPAVEVGVPFAVVGSADRGLALAAAAFHGFPGRRLKLVGVTGTDGKTTTSHLTAAILEAAGFRVGVITTVAVRVAGLTWSNATSHTTPQAPELQGLLAKMLAAGVEVAVVEVSSHALALDRVAGLDFDVGVFTNLTPEHLDFHGTMEAYRDAKAGLFRSLATSLDKGVPKVGVVNADDPSGAAMAAACPGEPLTYGLAAGATLTARDLRLESAGSRFRVVGPFGEVEVATSLTGSFNVQNWLAAIGAATSLGARPEHLVRAAAEVAPPPGRLQRIDAGQPFAVVVDFAHTPNALATALRALRPLTTGRLICAFGHAGGRDAANRPTMGEVVGRLADLAVVTTDDPYDEDMAAIVAEVAVGLDRVGRREGVDYYRVVDRREGIARALELARPGDTVLIAGRGHEQITTIRGQKVHLDDVEEAEAWLRGRPGTGRLAA